MKVGDLVYGQFEETPAGDVECAFGIVIEIINSDYQVPPVCKIMWPTGVIEKEWTDDVQLVD